MSVLLSNSPKKGDTKLAKGQTAPQHAYMYTRTDRQQYTVCNYMQLGVARFSSVYNKKEPLFLYYELQDVNNQCLLIHLLRAQLAHSALPSLNLIACRLDFSAVICKSPTTQLPCLATHFSFIYCFTAQVLVLQPVLRQRLYQ